MSKLKDFNKKKRNRSERDNFILSLSDEEALSLAFLTETVASKASLPTMQKIGDVILNRVSDQQFEFKNLKSIKDVLLQRTNRGKGSKMVAFDGLEPSILQARISEVLSGKAPDALEKTYTAAINTLDTEPDLEQYRLPSHILYYKKPGVGGSSWHDKSPLLAPLIDDEGHTLRKVYDKGISVNQPSATYNNIALTTTKATPIRQCGPCIKEKKYGKKATRCKSK